MSQPHGRHRKPSTTGRSIARIAVAGAVIGAPLALTAPASAAPNSDWDALAQCESGGDWSINTGNGYYGGVQFSASTWDAFGGGQFANNANQASREQQIVIAERTLAEQGWNAWPSCSRQLGLNSASEERSAPAADQDSDDAPAEQPAAAPVEQPSDDDRSDDRSSRSSVREPVEQAPVQEASDDRDSDDQRSDDRDSDDRDSDDRDSDNQRSDDRDSDKQRSHDRNSDDHDSDDRDSDEQAPAAEELPETDTSGVANVVSPVQGDGDYTVVRGDTMSKIAKANGVDGGYKALFELNRDVVENVDLIFPGETLRFH